jgi:hypothetical protein
MIGDGLAKKIVRPNGFLEPIGGMEAHIGIGSDLTTTPSHTTRHTDRVPGRFG